MGKIIDKILEFDLSVVFLFATMTLVHIALLIYSPKLYFFIIIMPLSVLSVIWYMLHKVKP